MSCNRPMDPTTFHLKLANDAAAHSEWLLTVSYENSGHLRHAITWLKAAKTNLHLAELELKKETEHNDDLG